MLLATLHLTASLLVALIGGGMTVAAALGGVAGFHAYRSAASGWREERDAAVAKADRLEKEMERLSAEVEILRGQIATLQAKDVSKLFDLQVEHHNEMMKRSEADARTSRHAIKSLTEALNALINSHPNLQTEVT